MKELAKKTDVLLVGFGPVGATMANLLGEYGVRVLAIDKATEIFAKPRAISLDNEALRILQLAGLREGSFDTVAIPEVRMRSPGLGLFARLRTAGCVDGHPKLVTFHQPDLEAALRIRTRQHPSVVVELGIELVALDICTEMVRATLRRRDGRTDWVEARYVVGADGASSKVRQMLGLGFEGCTYAEDWLIIDAKNVPTQIDHIEFLCDPRRPVPHMVAPGNRQRWEFMLQPGETAEEMESPEKVRELLAPWGDPNTMEVERTAVYRFHARTVARFSKGRVFLAGDAAHVTPPFAGQGLVAGLRDAANLAWKLAWVIQGRAHPRILDTYDEERRPHAKAMIRLARFVGQLVMPRSRLRSIATNLGFRLARQVPALRAWLEELKIKPKNRFARGLFVPDRKSIKGKSRMVSGEVFPQTWVSNRAGEGRWSDEVIGSGFALVGFGLDPEQHLSSSARAWRAAAGACVQLCHRGQQLHRVDGAHVWEDVTGTLVPERAPLGWAVVVRPDRTIMAQGPVCEADELVREALRMLGAQEVHDSSLGFASQPIRASQPVKEALR
ncbi:MAG: bifunctional 3-(3-hydroxy-phenyl)propionate/3-hydroxycinnamic acid hydroxylase [Polyangiales bacterium]